jgi:hypothetical protein
MSVVAGNGQMHLFKPEWSLTMKRIHLQKTLSAAVFLGGTIAASSASADSTGMSSSMMGGSGFGWMGGGGIWVAILLVVVVAGLVAWVVAQNKK